MPKEEWGVKRVCPTTGKRFYDLGRVPIVSPYTGEVVEIETGRGGRTLVADKATRPAVKQKVAVDDDDLVLDDDIDLDDDDSSDIDLDDDDVLEDDEEGDTVALDDLADVAPDDDET